MDNLEFRSGNEKNKDIYFSNGAEDEVKSSSQKPAGSSAKAKKRKKRNSVASTYLFFFFVIVVSMIVSVYAIFCMNDILAITKNTSTVTVSFSQEIKSTDEAIDVLSSNGLIKCNHFCKFFVKMRDKFIKSSALGAPYDAGVYYLNGKMGLEGMLVNMKGYNNKSSDVVKLTFPEGFTVPDIIKKLDDNDVCDREALLSVIESTSFNFELTEDLTAQENVPYRLEGYLFPDTYEFYVDESPASVIRKFLEQGDKVYTDKYSQRAKKLGLSSYEVMTIASIVQRETGDVKQMKIISGIIQNRLANPSQYPTIGCQSTTDYINKKVKPSLSSTSSHTSEYYLTYYNTNSSSTVVGLPAGPICNPGKDAIEAALYPADTDAKYFFHDSNGNMYTASSLSEFKDKVQQYAPYLEY